MLTSLRYYQILVRGLLVRIFCRRCHSKPYRPLTEVNADTEECLPGIMSWVHVLETLPIVEVITTYHNINIFQHRQHARPRFRPPPPRRKRCCRPWRGQEKPASSCSERSDALWDRLSDSPGLWGGWVAGTLHSRLGVVGGAHKQKMGAMEDRTTQMGPILVAVRSP